MTCKQVTQMAREAGMEFRENADEFNTAYCDGVHRDQLERFATLIVDAEKAGWMQLFTDPENQPTQHGTVTVEYMQREIAAEREACAKVVDHILREGGGTYGDAIRARGQA